MEGRLAIAIAASCLALASLLTLYAEEQLHRAALVRVMACQMLPDRKAWDDFECSRAFKEAQR